ERSEDFAGAQRVTGREIHDRLPEDLARVALFEEASPLLAECLPARLKNPLELSGISGRRAVLVVNQSDRSADVGLETRPAGAQAEVGVFEVRLEIGGELANGIEDLAPDIGAREHDAFDLAGSGVLPDVAFERTDLLAPHRLRKDVRSGMEEASVSQEERATQHSGRRGGRGA